MDNAAASVTGRLKRLTTSSEIAEHALAHIEGSATERAYRRTDFYDKRRALMQEWADFIAPGT